MRRCQHSCGCEGNAVGRDPDSGLLLCAACLGRSILGTDCSRARKYFGHVPVRFVNAAWTEPVPLRNGDRSVVPDGFESFLTVRTEPGAAAWDFLPLARAGTGIGVGAGTKFAAEAAAEIAAGVVVQVRTGVGFGFRFGTGSATNPQRPPKDPPSGPLPPPPARPVQPNPPRR
ncbi:hypothetical protein [Catenulispora rubra]|uniref:hypothetical protein n=1 Tax=Catenulispora rubra TaxID=280293 RepID=UPI0018922EF0|nr:hypothetical protein [Catenulispora rubra]